MYFIGQILSFASVIHLEVIALFGEGVGADLRANPSLEALSQAHKLKSKIFDAFVLMSCCASGCNRVCHENVLLVSKGLVSSLRAEDVENPSCEQRTCIPLTSRGYMSEVIESLSFEQKTVSSLSAEDKTQRRIADK